MEKRGFVFGMLGLGVSLLACLQIWMAQASATYQVTVQRGDQVLSATQVNIKPHQAVQLQALTQHPYVSAVSITERAQGDVVVAPPQHQMAEAGLSLRLTRNRMNDPLQVKVDYRHLDAMGTMDRVIDGKPVHLDLPQFSVSQSYYALTLAQHESKLLKLKLPDQPISVAITRLD